MKYSHRLSDAVHILTYLEIYHGQKISSQDLAASVDANPSLIRSLIAKMVKAGILKPKSDAPAPQLSRPAAEITLLDVYYAVEENHHLLHIDEQTNQQCPVGKNIQPVLGKAYDQIQAVAEAMMKQITLQDVVDEVADRIK